MPIILQIEQSGGQENTITDALVSLLGVQKNYSVMIGNSAFSNSENAVLTMFSFNPILNGVKTDYPQIRN